MNFKLRIWRQRDAKSRGKLVDYDAPDIPAQASLLEMLDIVNERSVLGGHNPLASDTDCRVGLCGPCPLAGNGQAHGPDHPGPLDPLYMPKLGDQARIKSQ